MTDTAKRRDDAAFGYFIGSKNQSKQDAFIAGCEYESKIARQEERELILGMLRSEAAENAPKTARERATEYATKNAHQYVGHELKSITPVLDHDEYDAYLAGFRDGEAAMRERAAKYVLVGAHGFDMTSQECVTGIRALPLSDAEPGAECK